MNKITLNYNIKFSKDQLPEFLNLAKPLYLELRRELSNIPDIQNNPVFFNWINTDPDSFFDTITTSSDSLFIKEISSISDSSDYYCMFVSYDPDFGQAGGCIFFSKHFDIPDASPRLDNLWSKLLDLRLKYYMGIPLKNDNATFDVPTEKFNSILHSIEHSTTHISTLLYYYDNILDNINFNIKSNTEITASRPLEILDEFSSNIKTKMSNILNHKIQQNIPRALILRNNYKNNNKRLKEAIH